MARNGHHKQVESLRREADERRAALRRTAHALEERLKESSQRVASAVERTRESFEGVDSFIQRHRYLIIGGAVGVGAMIGLRRRSPRVHRARDMDQAVRFIVERRPRRSAVRSLFGTALAMAARQALAYATERFYPPEEYEHLALPPGRPYAE